MGCRPSKHATSKIRDAHARGKHCTCMYSPRKYNKKHKCNSNGTGSRRTSGGTHSGSHGHSSTDHRSRSHKSDDMQFPAFSTTTAVYRRSASKASKITLRLSSDGSTLEIEQCEYDIAKAKPQVKSVSRPWNSAPNLSKVSDRGSPMLRNLDLLLRPSTSAWTNACASRSTPGSDHVPSAWRVHSAVRQRESSRQSNIIEDRTGRMNIRETVLIDSEPNTTSNILDDVDMVFVSNHAELRHMLSGLPQDKSLSARTAQAMIHPMAFLKEANFQPSNQSAHPLISPSTTASTFSQNPSVNMSCHSSQFGNTGCVNSDTVRRREKCTASLRRPEPPRRSGYHYNSDAQKLHKHSNDSRSNNDNNGDNQNDLKKLYQRASIPRYDCFHIRDYNNIYSQSASSILDSSIHTEAPQYSNWFERWQAHIADYGDAGSHEGKSACTEKLTDREKLVLNLSTRPSSMGSDGLGFTALVGRRDEKWHSNDNLIAGEINERPHGSILNSPVETDTVLTFVELGCPVSQQEDRYNTDLGSPLSFYSPVHATPCLGQCELFPKEIYQRKPLLTENDKPVNQNESDVRKCIANELSPITLSIADTTPMNRQTETSALDRFLLRNLEGLEHRSPERARHRKSGMIVVGDRYLSEGNKANDHTMLSIQNTAELERHGKSNFTWRQKGNRTSMAQYGQQVPDMTNYKTAPVKSPQQMEVAKQNDKDQEVGQIGNDNYGAPAGEKFVNAGEVFALTFDENGNSNYEKFQCTRSNLDRGYKEVEDNEMCIRLRDEDTENVLEAGKFPDKYHDAEDKISTDEETTQPEMACHYSGLNSQYVYDIILNRLSHAHTESLPLLCYNNSFGKRFQDTNILSNDNNVLDNVNTVSSYSFHPVNEEAGRTGGLVHPPQDQIDITFHSPQTAGRETVRDCHADVIESTTDFHGTTVSEKMIDALSDSRKFPPDGSANSAIAHSTNSSTKMSRIINVDEGAAVLRAGNANGESCELMNSAPSNTALIETQTTVHVISNKPGSTCPQPIDKGACQSDTTRQPHSSVHVGKKTDETTAKNNCRVCETPGVPAVTPVARSPVPLRILQARIIGRNISQFASRCLIYGPNTTNASTSSSPAPLHTPIIKNDEIDGAMGKREADIRNSHDLTSSVTAACSVQNPNQNSKPCEGGWLTDIKTNVDVQKQYVLKQAFVGDSRLVSITSRNSQMASGHGRDVEHISESVTSLCQDTVSSSSPEQATFTAKTSGSQLPVTSSSTSLAHADFPPTSLTSQSLFHDSSTTSVSHPSTVEFTCPDGETNFAPLAQSFPLPVPDLTSSSNEPYFLANTQLLSSHSSDSLSCSLSSYSLSNTLHSDTVVTDTTHSDTVQSDANLSDNVHSDTSHRDIAQSGTSRSDTICLVTSQVDIHQTNAQQVGHSLKSGNDESTIHQAPVALSDSYHSDTLKSNIVRSSSPSSFVSSQSHSPRSTPQSTLSPHSSSSSQCTLSPPSSPPTASFHDQLSDQTRPDLTYTQDKQNPNGSNKTSMPSLPPSFLFSQSTPAPSSVSSSSTPPPSPLKVNSFSAVDPELSIVAPSTSCRALPASNPESHQNQPITDREGPASLNPDEIQNSSWMPASCDSSKCYPEKWSPPLSVRSRGTSDILSSQNDLHHNSSMPSMSVLDTEPIWESIGTQIVTRTESGDEVKNHLHVVGERYTYHKEEIDTGSDEEDDHTQIFQDNSTLHSNESDNGSGAETETLDRNSDIDNSLETICDLNQNSQCFPGLDDIGKTSKLDLSPPAHSASFNRCQTVTDEMHSNSSHFRSDNAPANENGHLHVNQQAVCSQREVSPRDCEDRQWTVADPVKEPRSGTRGDSDRDTLCNSLHFPTAENPTGSQDRGDSHLTDLDQTTEKTESVIEDKRTNNIIVSGSEFSCQKLQIVDDRENTAETAMKKTRENGDSFRSEAKCSGDDTIADNNNKHCCEGEFAEGPFQSGTYWRGEEETRDYKYGYPQTVGNHSIEEKPLDDEILWNEKSCITDDIVSPENTSGIITSRAATQQTSDRDNQSGLFTTSSGHANLINIETTKQISLNKKRALVLDPSIPVTSIICANTDKVKIEQAPKCHIDSLCHFDTPREDQEQICESKMGRPKRNVQLLVKHFESVSLRSSAETQVSDKL